MSCEHCGGDEDRCCALSAAEQDAADKECAVVISLLRSEAKSAQYLAADYRIKHVTMEARVWSKVAESLGKVANRIERGEHRI
jgi:hypothetical protein